jgi:hypothetical protein
LRYLLARRCATRIGKLGTFQVGALDTAFGHVGSGMSLLIAVSGQESNFSKWFRVLFVPPLFG